MGLDDTSDEELVRRFRAGDAGAFDAIVHRFEDRIYRLACIWLFDQQLATDAAQEVFLRSYKGLHGFRFRAAPYTWLYRMTKNVCNEFNRKRRGETMDPELIDRKPDTASVTPEQHASTGEAARRVRALVAELPERQREVVLLRIFEDLPVIETAKLMGCREGTVKALLHKATKRLKLNIEEAGWLI